MPKPTLTPDDVPLEGIAGLVATLREQAEQIGQNARDRLAHNDLSGAVARYEAALARFQAAALLETRTTKLAATIAERHAERTEFEHHWPIPGLENTTHIHHEDGPNMGEEWDQKFPRWGLQVDTGGQETYVHITPASDPSYRHAERGAVLLRVTSSQGDMADQAPDTDLSMWISADQWNALNALAQRIGDRHPVPYDETGRVHPQTMHADTP